MKSFTRVLIGRRTLAICALGLSAMLAGGRAAKADTVTATLETVDPFVAGTVSLAGAGDIVGGIGEIIWQGDPSNAAPFNGAFGTYCIDLMESINLGQTYTFSTNSVALSPKPSAYPGGSGGPMGPVKADEMAELFGQEYANTLGAGNGLEREAMQLAIWNIVYDTDTSVSTGDGTFYAEGDVDPGAITIANGWLADAANPADQAIYHADDLVTLIGGPGVQDQITVNPTIGTGTPLPAPAAGVGLLMTGCAIVRLWKRHKLIDQGI